MHLQFTAVFERFRVVARWRRLIAAFAPLALAPPSALRPRSDLLAITHVTVVDAQRDVVIPDQTVIVTGNRITAVGASERTVVPEEARVVDGHGKYLIPGLWDMHVHLGNASEVALPLFIASGVTGVRDMGSPKYETLHRWSVEALAGQRVGPRIVAAGPILDGSGTDAIRVIVHTADDAKRAVDSLAALGVDFIKVHEHLSRDVYFAIASEARALSIPFVGHVPAGDTSFFVSGTEAANAGQASLEHMFGIPFRADTPLRDLYAALKRAATAVDPTLVTIWSAAHACDTTVTRAQAVRLAPARLRAFWRSQLPKCPSASIGIRAYLFDARLRGIRPLRDAGIPLLAGSDVGFPYVIPGHSLHHELALLVEAGLTPAEALLTATLNPARFFHREFELGTIEPGKLADLVLLEANPLASIANVARISWVIANGRLFARGELDHMAQRSER